MTELKWYGDKILEGLLGAIAKGIESGAMIIMEQADKDCPYDTGYLLSTSKLEMTKEGNEVVGYGSYDTVYACRLHEHPEFNFQNGKKGKWLEDACYAKQEEYRNAIIAEIRAYAK